MSDTTEGSPVYRATRTITYDFDNSFFNEGGTLGLERSVAFVQEGDTVRLILPPNATLISQTVKVGVLHPEETNAADA